MLYICNLLFQSLSLFLCSAIERTEHIGSEETDSELEERGDLIQFYNSVYVLKMKSFALRYAHSAIDGKVGLLLLCDVHFYWPLSKVSVLKNLTGVSIHLQMEAPPLSPFPSVRAQPLSPRRVSQRHSIFVSPHKNSSSLTPSGAYTYKFTGSPSKVCHAILPFLEAPNYVFLF